MFQELPQTDGLLTLQEKISTFKGLQKTFNDHYVVIDLNLRKKTNEIKELLKSNTPALRTMSLERDTMDVLGQVRDLDQTISKIKDISVTTNTVTQNIKKSQLTKGGKNQDS